MLVNVILVVIGLVILTVAADKLVEGASALALKWGVSPLMVGLTIVACGTSMPELVVSIQASYEGNPGIAVGNVVGSNIFNSAFILGVAAMIHPIACSREVIRRDVPIMIGSALLMWFFARDFQLSRVEGVILLVLFFAYNFLVYRQSVITTQPASSLQEVVEAGQAAPVAPASEGADSPPPSTLGTDILRIVAGLVGLVAGAKMLLSGSVSIATGFGISQEIIGLTLVAAGTSLPELATSVVAARKGQSEIALGNVVGSNIFNALGILGVAGTLLPLQVSNHMLGIDIPIMAAVTLGCLPIMWSGFMIVRLEAAILLAAYAGYTWILFQTPS